MQKDGKKMGVLALVFYSIVTFFYIYQVELSFLGIPAALHSRRIAAVILVVSGILAGQLKGNICYPNLVLKKNVHSYIVFCVILTILSYFLLLTIGKAEGVHLFEAMLNILLFGIPVYWAHTKIYTSLDDFMLVLVNITLIQTFFIVLCLYNASFAQLMDLTFNSGHDIIHMQELRSGYAGGIGCIAAPGAILYSLGLLSSSYLYINKRSWRYLLLFAVFSIVSTMLARSGLLFVFVCVLYILKQGHSLKKTLSFLVPGALAVILVLIFISSNSETGFLDERYQRYVSMKEDGVRESFFDPYFQHEDTRYPSLSIESFFIGTGMLSGKSGKGDIVNVDGGPLRVYSAVGFLLAIGIYIFMIRLLFKTSSLVTKITKQYYLFTFTIILLLADFKEPTFVTVWPMAIFFSIAYLGINRQRENIGNSLSC